MGRISQSATTLYMSLVGEMLNNNINSVSIQPTNEKNDTKMYHAIAESLQVIFDDALLASASAQLIIANDTRATPVVVYVNVLAMGDKRYIYAVIALNAIIVLAFCFEAARTKGWKGLPKFDYASVKSLIVGGSMGGKALGERVLYEHEMARSRWSGDTRDSVAGKAQVMLGRRKGLALVLGRDDKGKEEQVKLRSY